MFIRVTLFYTYQYSVASKSEFTNFKTYILTAILFNNFTAKLNK